MKRILALFSVFILFVTNVIVYAEETTNNELFAYAEFTKNAVTKMMEVNLENKKDPNVVERDGRQGWLLDGTSSGNSSIDCYLDNGYVESSGNTYVYEVEVDYYYADRMNFVVAYNSKDMDNKHLGQIETAAGRREKLHGITEWRTAKFKIYDAAFDKAGNAPDLKISANMIYRDHGVTPSTDTPYGTKYSSYYLETSNSIYKTLDPVIIGGVRVKKTKLVNPFDVKITTVRKSNNLFEGEEIKFDIALSNTTMKEYEINAKYEAQDEDGRVVAEKSESIAVGAMENKNHSVVFDRVPFGTLKLSTKFTCDGVEFEKVTNFSYNRDASETPNSFLGTNIHHEGAYMYLKFMEQEVELAKKAGFSTVRDVVRQQLNGTSMTGFQLIQPSIDSAKLLKENEIDFLPVITSEEVVDTEEERAELEKYSAFIAEYYKDKSYAVETHNEYHHIHPGEVTAEEFVGLLKSIYNGVKSQAPELKVIGVDSAGLNNQLLTEIFEAGGLNYMDGVSYHPYWESRGPEQAQTFSRGESVRELMDSFGGQDKENWITENGWPLWSGNPISELESAAIHVRTILMNAALKTFDKYYFYQFADSGLRKENKQSFYGIIKSSYGEVPYEAVMAYPAVCNVNYLLGNTTFVDDISGVPSSNATDFVYRFKRQNSDGKGEYLLALWSVKERYEMGIDLGVDKVYLYDMFGNESELYGVDGRYSLVLSDEPIYLIGDFANFKKCDPVIKTNGSVFNGAVSDKVIQNISAPKKLEDAQLIEEGSTFFVVEEANKVVDGKSSFVVNTPANEFFDECAEYRIEKDGKTYYHGNISVNLSDAISFDVENVLASNTGENRWRLNIKISNNSNARVINGILKINSPQQYAKLISEINVENINPTETKTYSVFLPEVVTKEMQKFSMTLTLDSGAKLDYYKPLFFTAAPYSDVKPVIDGVYTKGEYSNEAWFIFDGGQSEENIYKLLDAEPYTGAGDLSGKATMTWDKENLYMFVEMTDDVHYNEFGDSDSWKGDSIQIGIADEGSQSKVYCELTAAKIPEGDIIYRHGTNNKKAVGPVENKEIKIVRKGNKTQYEMALPWDEILTDPSKIAAGYRPRFAFLINENDGLGRTFFMEYSQVLGAIGNDKNVEYFTDAILGN